MLGARVQDPRRSHAAFLLPSFPGFLRRRKRVAPPAAQDPGPAAGPAPDDHLPLPSNRSSVASTASVRTASTDATARTSTGSAGSTGSTGSTGTSPASSASLCTASDRRFSLLADADATLTEPETLPPPPAAANRPPRPRRRRGGLVRAQPDTLRCRRCAADLAFAAQIVSKGFTGRHGRAYLVSAPATSPGHLLAPGVPPWAFPDSPEQEEDDSDGLDDNEAAARAFDRARFRDDARDAPLANVRMGRPETRQLLTGAHVVADMACAQCDARLGWKYVDARDAAQRYKVGKFILDVARLSTFRSWEGGSGDEEEEEEEEDGDIRWRMDPPDDAIEFDSGDEDECEEIFAGTWDAATVAARRRRRALNDTLR